jgi:hypothetical protein
MRQSNFENLNARIIELVTDGETLADACDGVGLPYATARGWVKEGRKRPEGRFGGFAQALDDARSNGSRTESRDGARFQPDEEYEPGAVEREVGSLVAGRALDGQARIAAVQARALARQVDNLAASRSGSAALGLAAISRRLDDVLVSLRLQPEDELTRIGNDYKARRARMRAVYGNGVADVS